MTDPDRVVPPPVPLAAADSAWLRMEDATNLMTVTGVIFLREPLEMDRLYRLIEERLLTHERFRHRVVESTGRLGKPHWELHPEFRLENHVQRIRLPDPADESVLQDFVGEVMGTPMDYSRPLWSFQYVENLPQGSAIVARLHHCLGDGIALMRLLLGLTTAHPNEEPTGTVPASGAPVPSALGPQGLLQSIGSSAATLGKLAFMRSDPKTIFKGGLGTAKRAIWSRRIPLDRIKRAGRVLGGTVNDLLLAAVTGALRTYMERHHTVPHKLNVRAVVPVNLRSPHEPPTLGNRFGLVFLSLPVGIADRRARLHELKRRMDRLKRSAEAGVVYAILRMLGVTAAAVEMMVVNLLGKNATAVMTNVPGPHQPLYLCGAEIEDLIFWVPQSGKLSLGVSILSYVGQVRLGLAVDKQLVPDPEAIIGGFHESLEELLADADAVERAAAADSATPPTGLSQG